MSPVLVSQGLDQIPCRMTEVGVGPGCAQPHSAQDAPRERPALMCVVPIGVPCARDSGHQCVAPQPSSTSRGGSVKC